MYLDVGFQFQNLCFIVRDVSLLFTMVTQDALSPWAN